MQSWPEPIKVSPLSIACGLEIMGTRASKDYYKWMRFYDGDGWMMDIPF